MASLIEKEEGQEKKKKEILWKAQLGSGATGDGEATTTERK